MIFYRNLLQMFIRSGYTAYEGGITPYKEVHMKAAKKNAQNENALAKVARSVSFSSDRLSNKRTVSKDRERYIKRVSAQALSAVSA